MPVPLSRGKPYYSIFSASLSPVENNSVSANIGSKYSFAPGNTVIITRTMNSFLKFEGIVNSYDSSTGDITIDQITNIKSGGGGSWPSTGQFVITLGGERGSKITAGGSAPSSTSGREGDMYINTSTGEVYIKS